MSSLHNHTAQRLDIPKVWERRGLAIARPQDEHGNGVTGDPCIVWDEEISSWRMFLFIDTCGQGEAICRRVDREGIPLEWSPVQPLHYTGYFPDRNYYHKPYIVQEAHHPNRPAKINGEYWLLTVAASIKTGRKDIFRARSRSLAGPWKWDEQPIIPHGNAGEFDEKHTDAISGFYFPERDEVLYFYMGYPAQPQTRAISPLGNAEGIAAQRPNETVARKLGILFAPVQKAGHWASGYFGGFQILPGKQHRWIALLNASPTAPTVDDHSVAREEPAPSLGGWAYCDEEWPVKNWHLLDNPMEWIEDIPQTAITNGEGTNLWRHHALVLPNGRIAVFYNSGYYGKEQLYMKLSGDNVSPPAKNAVTQQHAIAATH